MLHAKGRDLWKLKVGNLSVVEEKDDRMNGDACELKLIEDATAVCLRNL